ncbi:amino acid ABC transporter permease [Sinirhodobacter populi]|uniref:Amino acid ABC transporter permease n=1 Tax=Paenirhodobacter populi TaxID=2306993 RepID=A0A443K001_9RHOB|nr:amino acid ABC transporter permease [Sinirhodobacter populi]RWR26123.1 amino acid ABC transporter permease [Sinirhodobacter populi]
MFSSILSEWPDFATWYNFIFFAKAAGTTLALSAIGVVMGSLIGLVLAISRITSARLLAPVRWLALIYTEVFRRVPFLVTLMLVFFSFQILFRNVPLFVVAATATTLIASAFLAEIVRAGLHSVHRNQWEAAVTMNFTLWQTVWHVLLPQAWRVILPPAFSFFVLFIKDTALASQIGVIELTYAGKVMNNKGFSATLAFGAILLIYFAISYPLARMGTVLEKRLAPSRNQES